MTKIAIVGGGIAGCQAAITAKKLGAEVTLLERSDSLGGCAILAGDYRGNTGYTMAEELIILGGGDLIELCDSATIHKVEFPGESKESHVWVYDVMRFEEGLKKLIDSSEIEVRLRTRAKDIIEKRGEIKGLITDDGSTVSGDVYLETTGTSGPIEACREHGLGCAECFARCPTFGSRISIAAKAGVKTFAKKRSNGKIGSLGAGITFAKESIDKKIIDELEKKGILLIPIPEDLVDYKKFEQFAIHIPHKVFVENLCLVDNGFAKVRLQMYIPLEILHKIPGFERARYIDPIAGGIGNRIRGIGGIPADSFFKVKGLKNLFCGGEVSGFGGIVGAIVSGAIAGHNAVRSALGKDGLRLPDSTLIGDFLGRSLPSAGESLSLQSASYFADIKKRGLYSVEREEIRKRIEAEGLEGILEKI
ncbi:MAG: FAD-dependent oxidoreductase [bacterium]|nr:FAD-dependent oxidoreductase [bacterium]